MYCVKCGREISDNAIACPSCGEPTARQSSDGPVSLGNWFLTMLLAVIPIANVVMIFVWAFSNSNPSKKNWARASLIWVLVGILSAGAVALAISGGLALLGLGQGLAGHGNTAAASQSGKNDSASPFPSVVTIQPQATPSDAMPADRYAGFIFPDSDTRVLEQREIQGLSRDELSAAINELYARHGYIFRASEIQEYYEQFSWYTPEVPADNFSVADRFSLIEKQNLNTLGKARDSLPDYEYESDTWAYATLASSGDYSVEALVLRELTANGGWSKYFDGTSSDVWLKEYPTSSSRVRQTAKITTGRDFELFVSDNANAYLSRNGAANQNMTAYDMAVAEYSQSTFDHMHAELDWLGANTALDSTVQIINGNSWYVYSGSNSGKGTQDCFYVFFFMDAAQEIAAEVSFEYVLYSGASRADATFFNEWYLNLSDSLLIR